VSFWQTVLFLRRPRHVILQFIMREKTRSIASQLKYLVMKTVFISLHRAICSARPEIDYYLEAFGWPHSKGSFVPLPTASKLLSYETSDTEDFVFAGGRIHRDYAMLVHALAGGPYRAIVVSDREHPEFSHNSNVQLYQNISLDEFYGLLAKSRIVVLPLEHRPFSIGQTVLLEAMAMGKPVVATRTAGTIDYIEDQKSGILVAPADVSALRDAVELLMMDEELRIRIGDHAKQTVRDRHLPHHYSRGIREVLLSGR